ncbi:MAG: efflux RND transporter periplasmic adaptor subunit [Nitrospirota bacterium]
MRLKPVHACTKLIIVFTLFLILSACSGNGKAKQAAQRVVPVKIGDVMQQNIPVQINAIGNVEAYNAVSIKALVGGEVEGVYFQEGQEVKKGDLLFKIDARPYAAALRQAEAALARDQAQAKNAEEQARRYAVLVEKEYVSKDQYDQLRANADALAATIDADRANVDNSRLQLEYCTIKSPINGRAGTVLVNNGNVIKANDIAMTTINQIVPTYVTFSVPEQNLSDIKKYTAMKELKVEAIIPGEEKRPVLGELTFIDNAVDKTTGTITLKGTFQNTDRRLWPGQFVNVVLTLTTQRNAVVMPAAALQAGQQGQYVFVVKPDFTVESRPVTVAWSYGDLAVVAQGVTPGEKVVTDGQLNLVSGVTVELKGEQPQNAPVKSGQTGSDRSTADQANKKQKAGNDK